MWSPRFVGYQVSICSRNPLVFLTLNVRLAFPTVMEVAKRLAQMVPLSWMFVVVNFTHTKVRPCIYRNPLDDMLYTYGVL